MEIFKIKISQREKQLIDEHMKFNNWKYVKKYKIFKEGSNFILEVDEDSGTSLAGELATVAATDNSNIDYNLTF